VTRPAVPTGLERPLPDCWSDPGGTDRCLCGTVANRRPVGASRSAPTNLHGGPEAAVKRV
jgi:hypothetical protein